jgi:hypothetical protein
MITVLDHLIPLTVQNQENQSKSQFENHGNRKFVSPMHRGKNGMENPFVGENVRRSVRKKEVLN